MDEASLLRWRAQVADRSVEALGRLEVLERELVDRLARDDRALPAWAWSVPTLVELEGAVERQQSTLPLIGTAGDAAQRPQTQAAYQPVAVTPIEKPRQHPHVHEFFTGANAHKFAQQQRRTATARLPGLFLASAGTIDLLQRINAIKDELDRIFATPDPRHGTPIDEYEWAEIRQQAPLLRGLSRKQVLRKIPWRAAPVERAFFSWISGKVSSRTMSAAELIDRIRNETGSSDRYKAQWIEERARTLALLTSPVHAIAPDEILAIRTAQPPYPGLTLIGQGERKVLRATVPLFLLHAGDPPAVKGLKNYDPRARAEKGSRADAIYEPEPFVPSRSIYRRKPQHRIRLVDSAPIELQVRRGPELTEITVFDSPAAGTYLVNTGEYVDQMTQLLASKQHPPIVLRKADKHARPLIEVAWLNRTELQVKILKQPGKREGGRWTARAAMETVDL